MSKTEKLLNALESGARLTSRQISSRYGLKNPTAAITNLRQEGHSIYFNRRKNTESFYRMGRPTRELIAAGYRALVNHV
jgi:hypothetical protein